jgi:hypothetical protein
MPGTPITNDLPSSPIDLPLVLPWNLAARAVCDVTTGVSDLADVLQGHPELLRYDFADLEAAYQALGRILDFVKRRAANSAIDRSSTRPDTRN